MYAYIKGEITYKSPTLVFIEAGGVGYALNISLYTYDKIENESKTQLLTHLIVREDELTLYGFSEVQERDLFVKLISVSGIGPNTARLICSSLSPNDIINALLSEDSDTFKRVKGIGAKTAQRLIIELKDKVKDHDTIGVNQSLKAASDNTNTRNEALQALIALGFQKNKTMLVLNKIINENKDTGTTEELIKLALKKMS